MRKHGKSPLLSPIRHIPIQKSPSQLPKIPHSPKAKPSSQALKEGIRTLEDFGFRAESSLSLPPRLTLLSEQPSDHPSKPLLHVTDFWSSRQQMEFLKKTGLKQAQRVRERQERREAFVTSLERVEEGRENDFEYERLMAEENPVEATKLYAAGHHGKLLKQLRNQVTVNSPGLTR